MQWIIVSRTNKPDCGRSAKICTERISKSRTGMRHGRKVPEVRMETGGELGFMGIFIPPECRGFGLG